MNLSKIHQVEKLDIFQNQSKEREGDNSLAKSVLDSLDGNFENLGVGLDDDLKQAVLLYLGIVSVVSSNSSEIQSKNTSTHSMQRMAPHSQSSSFTHPGNCNKNTFSSLNEKRRLFRVVTVVFECELFVCVSPKFI